MKINKFCIRILAYACVFLITSLASYQGKAQEVYANIVKDSTSDFRNAHRIVDGDRTNYASISTAVSLLTSSHLRVGFPVSGKAGDAVNFTVQGTGQLLGVGLLSNVTVRLYDSLGNQVAVSAGSNDLELTLLTDDSVYNIRYVTNPAGSFKFKDARIELNNFLTLNLLAEFRVFGAYYQIPCPPTFANTVNAFGTNSLLTGYVTDANNSVDANTNNYATLNTPLNILSLLPPAYLDLKFPEQARPGEYLGFTIGKASSLLSAGLLASLELTLYDENGSVKLTKNNFNTLDLRLLEGTVDRYVIGVTIPANANYRISRARIQLNSVLSLLQNLRVYNAFHYQLDRPPVPVTFSKPPIICEGDNVVLTAAETPGAMSYAWSNGGSTRSIIVKQSGIYSVTVFDSFNCSRRSIDINVVVNPLPVPVIVGDTVSCESTVGTLRTSIAYQAYTWNTTASTPTIDIKTGGNYSVTVADNNGCVASDNVNVINNKLTINSTISNTTCSDNATGSIALAVSGGSSNYSYRWSNEATTGTVSNLGAGIYTVNVKDENQGCSYNRAYTVNADNNLSVKSATVNTSGCGMSDGRASVSVVGGSGAYTYLWSNGANTASISDVKAGVYKVAITNTNSGCGTTHTVVISDGASGLNVTANTTNTTSCSAANGTINLAVTGGNGVYTYKWGNNATTPNRTQLAAGTYHVMVTDTATKCVVSKSIEINNASELTISSTVTPAGCGKSTGAVVLAVSGGTNSYTYKWSDGITTANRTNIATGNYIVTVTDNITGCTGTKLVVVGTATAPAVTLEVTQPSCGTNDNGAINITTTGSYNYMWSDTSITKDISNLKPGTYSVVVSDPSTFCKATYQATVETFKQIQLVATPTSNTSCATAANGEVDVMVTGGKSPFKYAWSNSDTTQDISELTNGNYTLNVTDANNCSANISVPITTDTNKTLKVTVDSIKTASCNSASNATLSVNVNGGFKPYAYKWSNGDTTQNLSNILPGSYSITVTDSVGCTATLAVQVGIDSANMIRIAIDSAAEASCSGSATGALYVTTTGGKAPYGFLWSNGRTTEDIQNVPNGSYTLVVTDDNGCTAQAQGVVPVDSANMISIAIDSATKASCTGSATGALYVTTTGGTAPYGFLWSNGRTTEDILNVPGGTYTLVVTDDNGCTTQAQGVVPVDSANMLVATATTITEAKCAGSKTGAVDVTVTGGTIPYTYAWSNGAITEDLAQVESGSYSLTVTDVAGCTGQLSVNIGIDTANAVTAVLDSLINVGCVDPNSGKIFTSVNGGTSPFSYLWNDGNTSDDRINLPGGDYKLTVTDGAGCKDDLEVTISNAALLVVDEEVKNISCNGVNDGSIMLTIAGSRTISYMWSNGATTNDLMGLSAGMYTVRIFDNTYKCELLDSFTITEPDSLNVIAQVANDDCFDNPAGKIMLEVSGGVRPYSYEWSNGSMSEDLEYLMTGNYNVKVTDQNGCNYTAAYTVDKDSCNYDIVIRTAMTPNGDGMNETWIIEGIQYYPGNVVYIYNKWGDLVYNTSNYDNTWRGTKNNGESLGDGTYYYVLKLNTNNRAGGKNEFSGFLMIQR